MATSSSNPLRGVPEPALRCTVHVAERPLANAADSVGVLARLADGGRRTGALLLESADVHAPEGRRSLVLPVPVLRLLLRGDETQLRALDPRGDLVVDALVSVLRERGYDVRAARSASGDRRVLEVATPRSAHDPAATDRDRLTEPSCLDVLRLVATCVGDTLEDGATTEGAPLLPALYGGFGYELVDRFEDLPPRRDDPQNEPDLDLVLALDGVVWDHERDLALAVTRSLNQDDDALTRLTTFTRALDAPADDPVVLPPVDPTPPAATPDLDDARYEECVHRFLEHVAAGDIFQGVLSRSLSVESSADPLDVYRCLRARNPSPYMFFARLDDGVLLGASPETCVRVERGEIMLSPIAGTVPRGFRPDGTADFDRDVRLAIGLLLDPKEQAEHAMLIDLARNDVARIARPGTREVEGPFTVERFSHVQHLVSRVRGRLDEGLDSLDAYRACANMGTLTGAPKLRAMELIREHEGTARGFYGGAFGYLTSQGDFDSCIVIRALRWMNGLYVARAGAGIVAASLPKKELLETIHKARAPLVAVALAERRSS
ncbi:MAG: anthranilate synthase component I [Planctomycetes bacterium]|nr:anthranilate synthase component I [Planctomycetota bacterium]